MLMLKVSIAGMIFALIIGIFYLKQVHEKKASKKRVDTWFESNKKERRSFLFLIGDKYDNSEFAEVLSKKLVHGNLKLKPSEYTGLCIILFGGLWFLNHNVLKLFFPLDITLAYFLVWLGSKMFLKSRQNKRTEEMNKQLPEICRMMGNAVKAGLTIPQGIDMVAKELKAPAKPEFQRMQQQLRLGDDLEIVMTRYRNRIVSNELNIFVSTILIQRKVGGNLSEVLNLMAETLEERTRVNKEVQTVTAEAKFVSIILPLLPVLMAMMMNLFIPGFLNPLFTPVGLIVLVIFAGIQFISYLIIKRISVIRV
ncbi:type II secretion system F family protein [Virgibacillus necropolis]|uniref:type II secretion system F family protein n=1 Tax=Virgibacillus necropolis TaxID=163877 RepID=UPI00384EB062